MTSLFIINETDFTEYVNRRSYTMHENNIIGTWVDVNHVTHGDLLRKKVKGSFKMMFTNALKYNEFVTCVNQNRKADSKVPVTVYVDGRNAVASFNAFLDVSNVKPIFSNDAYGGNPVVFGVTVSVEEE